MVIGGFRDVTPHMEWGTSDDSSEALDSYVSAQLKLYLPSALPDLFALPGALPRPTSSSSAATGGGGGARPPRTQDVLVAAPTSAQAPSPPGAAAVAGAAGNWTKSGKVLSTHAPGSSGGAAAAAATVAGGGGGGPAGCGSAAVPVQYDLEWAGILGFTKDHWPLWGALPPELASSPPKGAGGGPTFEYVCMGFSGYGMVRAYNCARNLALLLTGRPLEPGFPAKVFSPARALAAPASKM